jgi:Tfp pilus assembly pilus retraction ATPase PilT
MIDNAIKVTVRVRPDSTENLSERVVIDEASNSISVSVVQANAVEGHSNNSHYDFPFDRVLDASCNQEKIFRLSSGIIDEALNGFNGSVLSYGQTGAGKVTCLLY